MQRGITGATALVFQPTIDYYNKNVDEVTRNYSVAKTTLKVLITAIGGVTVRALAIKYGKHVLDNPDKFIKYYKHLSEDMKNRLLDPEKLAKQGKNVSDEVKVTLLDPEKKEKFAINLGNAVGIFATIAEIALADVPLVNKSLDIVMHKIFPNIKKDKSNEG
ncbi:MAG: hypothetical protein MZV70_76895 [Desulfobacterales bacterium]|nr:hypothetical protein [Desulfobacterales bacterium]